MKLEDIVDLEAQIALDREREASALQVRDRAIHRALPELDSRPALLVRWLDALRASGENPKLGRRVVLGYRWARLLLVLVGFVVGWGTATALLAYHEEGPPVNVGTFLLVVVGAQLALLFVWLVGIPIVRVFPNAPFFGDVQLLWCMLATWLGRAAGATEAHLSVESREALKLARARLRRRGSLYRPLERWTLLGLSQTFGVAFNAGILASGLLLVVTSDLAFGWGTTAEALDAEAMHRVVRTVATPWAEQFPEAVPSRKLVAESRYSRLEGRYTRAAPGTRGDPKRVGGWWPFLIAATITYGLLPRLLLLVLATVLRARSLTRVPLDTPEVEQIVRRLTAPRIATQGEHRVAGDRSALPEEGHSNARSRPAAGATCVAVRWRNADAPESAIRRVLSERFGWSVTRVLEADFARPGDPDRTLSGDGPVVVLAESWEPPDKGLRRWLTSLRGAVGDVRPIWVLLFGGRSGDTLQPAHGRDLAIWRDRLELVEDPWLGVESVEAA